MGQNRARLRATGTELDKTLTLFHNHLANRKGTTAI